MAAILQLRRGTTPSTTIAEPYFNTSLGTLQVGDGSTTITLVKIGSNTGNVTISGNLTATGISTFSAITGSNLYITENVTIDGNIHIGGNITLGSGSDGDIVNVNAPLSGSIIPETTDIFDLGASDKKYRNLYVLSASIENVSLPGSGILSSSNENFTTFSQSVDSRLDNLQLVSESQDGRLDNLELTSESYDGRLDQLETETGSLQTQIDDLTSITGSYATTGSNIFFGNQEVNGDISIIDGEFGVITGSGDLTSSLSFTHNITAPNDGNATLELRHINNDSNDNIAIKLKTDFAGALLQYEESGIPYSVLSVQSFVNRNIYIHRDTRLFASSLRIDNNLTVTGSLIVATDVYSPSFSGSFTGSFSGSLATQDDRLTNLEETSQSFDNRLDNLELTSASYDGRLDNLELTSSSHDNRLDQLETETGSIALEQSIQDGRLDNLELTSESYDSRLNQLETETGSITLEQSIQDGRLDNLELTSESHDGRLDYLEGEFSTSLDTRLDLLENFSSSEYNNDSQSFDSRLDYLEGEFSTSVDSRLDSIQEYTSSLKQAIDVSGQDLTIYGNLVVQGETTTLNTTELVIEDKLLSLASGSTTSAEADGAGIHISGADASMLWDDVNSNLVFNQKISSSVGFKGDGSELTDVYAVGVDFDDIDNKPTLVSGSSQVTSSLDLRYLEINGDSVVSGSSQITITNTTGFTTFSGSLKTTDDGQDSRLDNLESFSSSQESKDSTIGILTASYDGRLSNLESFTGSQETKNSTLETYTSSVDSHISNLESFTGSQETKNTTLETVTSSFDNRISQLESDSGSQGGRLDNLEGFTSSIDTTIKTKLNVEGIVSSSSDTSTISLSIQDGVMSGEVIGGIVSGSDQVTASLDSRYLQIDGDGVISGSDQVTESLDLRYEEIASETHTLVSGSDQITSSLDLLYEVSGSVAQLTGIHAVSGSLGSAAWYNVSSSISDGNPQILGNAGAVKSYIDEALIAVGAGDITKVTAGLGMSGSTDSGEAVVAIDTASAHFTEGVNEAIQPFSSSVSASLSELSDAAGYINYVTNSIEQLTGIEVADFDNNVAVTFIGGTLKFIFGTPAVPSSINTSLSGFLSDRFNQVEDEYTINGTWNNGGYTLISASLYEGTTLLEQVGSGTSLSHIVTTSGSHTYKLEYTGSSPLDGSIYTTSTTVTGTISKTNPASPTLTPSATIQLGVSGNQIEQGATGSISFTSSSADPSNGWNLVDVTTNVESPYLIEGPLTGSTSISITATANYESPIGDNNPDLSTSSNTSRTYTKIRSLRYGSSTISSFTEGDLANLALWDTSLGGSVGTIVKGTTNPSGQTVTITHSGDEYHYIVYDSSRSNLTGITTSGFDVFNSFAVTTVGQYKIYKSTTLQAGGAGTSFTYTLT